MLLYLLLRERAPSTFQVLAEVPVGRELPRADVLLLRREREAKPTREAGVLLRLWEQIARDAVVEFKSVSRPFSRGDLGKLLGYAGLYYSMEAEQLGSRENLVTVLIVPSRTEPLAKELDALGMNIDHEDSGYQRVRGCVTFPLLVISLDEVARSADDELLAFLGRGTFKSVQARRWLQQAVGQSMAEIQELDDFDDVEKMFVASLSKKSLMRFMAAATVEERLAGLAPEQLLAGLAPEQLLAGLAPEQLLAGLDQEQRAELLRLLLEGRQA
jgi:hypothetical protein